jgi:DNA-binding SARP family transcriptional activator
VARHKLHVAASALRGALQRGVRRREEARTSTNEPRAGRHGQWNHGKSAGYLIFRNGGYELDPTSVRVDVDEFERLFTDGQAAGGAAAIPSYQAACRLYSGTFLPEDLYADWSFMRREQLAQRHVTMCSALAAHELAAGHYAAAVQWATAMLEEDRCNESAYRQLMRAYAAEGRRGEALRQYQRCEQVLQAELGVSPMPETTAVFYALLKGETPPGETVRA